MNQNQERKFNLADIKVIIGLGNPGSKYRMTRHNIGFLIIDALVDYCGVIMNKSDLMEHGQAVLSNSEQKIILIKPQTFMNGSGKVLPSLLKKGIKVDQILVIHDELEKKFGVLQLKCGGSIRGHNGLRSIADFIGLDFWRLRFGVDRPQSHEKTDVGSYVLNSYSSEEMIQLANKIEKTVEFLLKS